MADQEHNWKCVQCFGDRGDSDDITDGNYLAAFALVFGRGSIHPSYEMLVMFFSRLSSRERAEYQQSNDDDDDGDKGDKGVKGEGHDIHIIFQLI